MGIDDKARHKAEELKGKAKESGVSGEIAMRLMDEVWKILGIEPPKK